MIQISRTTIGNNPAFAAAPAGKTAASSNPAIQSGPAKPAHPPQGVGGNVDKSV